MASQSFEIKRTGWDLLLGALLVVGGIVIVSHAVLATAVWVALFGWITLFGGVFALIGALLSIGKPSFWPAALTGALLTVLGILILRNLAATAVTLTLVAGALFLVSGIVRIAAGFDDTPARAMFLFSGLVSAVLGLIVLLNLFTASFVLLGTLIGIELIVDGITLALIGRPRRTAEAAAAK